MDPTAAISMLEAGLSHCVVAIDRDGGLIGSLLVAGLVGGLTHCAGMCGPFVLAQTTARLESVPASRMSEFHRLRGAALLPYHAGRLVTYAFLGAMAAMVGGGLTGLTGWSWVPAILLSLAALFFLVFGLRGFAARLDLRGAFTNKESTECAASPRPSCLRGSLPPPPSVGGAGWGLGRSWTALTRPLFRNPTGGRGFLLGLALGFIPCGLLYGAIAAAAASGDPVTGAIGLAAFALGTMPSLFAVGFAGHLAGRAWSGAMAWATPAIMTVNAAVLCVFAWRMI